MQAPRRGTGKSITSLDVPRSDKRINHETTNFESLVSLLGAIGSTVLIARDLRLHTCSGESLYPGVGGHSTFRVAFLAKSSVAARFMPEIFTGQEGVSRKVER
ncbi:hypothetical protein KCU92_g75, partial [Aureobasidium melanogenum]